MALSGINFNKYVINYSKQKQIIISFVFAEIEGANTLKFYNRDLVT